MKKKVIIKVEIVDDALLYWSGGGPEYSRDPNKSGGGTLTVTCPPTAHMVQSISRIAVAVDTLGW